MAMCLIVMWSLLAVPAIQAQDVSINILSTPASLPLSTTGSIQVDLCNTDPGNITAPISKINPQISVGPNVIILGVTNIDGSPLTSFTVVSNSGQIVRLSNTVPLPNPTCSSFRVIVQGNIIDAPGIAGGIVAMLDFQGSPTAGNKTFNDNSSTSVSVVVNPQLGPDMTPIIYARPSSIYGNSPFNVVVDVLELNSIATGGVIVVKLTRDPKLKLSFDPVATSINGQTVQNSAWSFDGSSSAFYILTTNQAIPAGGRVSFGLSGTLSPGATAGVLTVSSTIVSSGGELKITNNISANKIEYFNQ